MNISIDKISIYNIVKLVLTLLLVEHFFSCLWVFIGLLEYENEYPNWISARALEHEQWTV
jgi:hypothetical protein